MINTRAPGNVLTKNMYSPKAPKQRSTGKSGVVRQPKTAIKMTPDAFERQLKKRSPWYQSIMDPLRGAGARVPDPSGWNTACYQWIADGAVTVSPAGVAGIRALCLNPATNTSNIGTINTAYGFQLSASDATAANLAFGTGGTQAATQGQSIVPATMNSVLGQGLAVSARVVSAGIYLWYEGSLLNTAGDFIIYANPGFPGTGAQTADSFAQIYGATVSPVTQGRAALARWLPISKGSAGARTSTVNQLVPTDYRSFTPITTFGSTMTADNIAREFGIVARGLPAGANLRYRIVSNIEFIPSANSSSLLSASPSPIDMAEESFCLEKISVEDIGSNISASSAGAVPSVSKVVQAADKETSGVLGSVIKAAGFVGDILEVAAPLLAAL